MYIVIFQVPVYASVVLHGTCLHVYYVVLQGTCLRVYSGVLQRTFTGVFRCFAGYTLTFCHFAEHMHILLFCRVYVYVLSFCRAHVHSVLLQGIRLRSVVLQGTFTRVFCCVAGQYLCILFCGVFCGFAGYIYVRIPLFCGAFRLYV